MSNSPTHIITILCHPDRACINQPILQTIAQCVNAKSIACLAENIAYDLVPHTEDTPQNIAALVELCIEGLDIDYTIVPLTNRRKKLLIADMDSTMIDQECIDELADYAGFKTEVSEITARAMNGELEFESALRERVSLLKGLDLRVIDTVMEERISMASGGRTLVQTMKAHGAYCALVSGGFTQFTERVAVMLGFDENRANRLLATGGKLNGEAANPILGSNAKVEALNDISGRLGITTDDSIAVGDGANDLAMLKTAGLGVALHAKPSVAAAANIKIDHSDLTSLLFIQGYKENEFRHG